ncbi:hypothetical protein H0H81_000075 [Sphagnurus paluster]|uniref:NmrA-like domain-containing protein n=1 Tax=Sphagnurus paluster TaxID=117069 RepID=A0A9P7GW90_9AGAR|nr:hypothetical protein H0H81_000075 [Sphagnurus paluster]
MTTLLTGGTGKIGIILARLLTDANHSVLLASRSGKVPEPFKGVAFDWFDRSTWENSFKVDSNIDRIYLVGPSVLNMLSIVKDFIELAITKGVVRFVLVSASTLPRGGPHMGQVHHYLSERGVEYAVLRPTWFSENFAYTFRQSIRENDTIATATGSGRIPFVSVHDIADAAFKALVEDVGHNTEYIVLGPELYSNEEAAALFSDVLGRKITHKQLTDDESKKLWLSFGLDEDYANMMLAAEHLVATGEEEKLFHSDTPLKFVGTRRLKDYLQANREIWAV